MIANSFYNDFKTNFFVSAIRCPPLVFPNKGFVNCSGLANLNTVCLFECEHGYELVGNKTTQCIKNFADETFGEWTNKQLICEGK